MAMERTIVRSKLKLEIKREVDSRSFKRLVDYAQQLVEKYPHKDTQWIARALATYMMDNGYSAIDNKLTRYRVDGQWVVALTKGRMGLPDVLIYVDEKEEAA